MSDDDFETPQFQIKILESPKRMVQLRPPTPTFGPPPRTDSFSSMNLTIFQQPTSEQQPKTVLARRAKSTTDLSSFFNRDPPELPISPRVTIQEQKVLDQLSKLSADATPFVRELVSNSAKSQNQAVIDLLNINLFLPLSSIIHAYPEKKALIILPSVKISQWVRGFLLESSAMCPEGRTQQQKVLNQVLRGKTQVLLCVSNRLSTLSISMFDIIYVVKTELVIDQLPPLFDYHGILLFHVSPGFEHESFFDSFKCKIMRNPDLAVQCIPNSVFETDYIDTLLESIDTSESTCVIVPFKSTIDKIIKKVKGKCIRYDSYAPEKNQRKACITTTAIFYNIYNFNHYIFLDFPPSLSYFLYSTYASQKVTVFVSTPVAIKLQALSHNCGLDLPLIQQLLQAFFWNGNAYRKENEFCVISTSGIDVTDTALNSMIFELTRRDFLRSLAFNHLMLNVKILLPMEKSDLISAISKNKSNMHGYYNIPIINLCNQLGMEPGQLESELERLSSQKVVQYKFNESAMFFKIKKEFKDDDEFMAVVNDMHSYFNQLEEKKNHDFDVLFTLIQKCENDSESIEEIYEKVANGEEPPNLISLPYEPINTQEIEKFLTNARSDEMIPRVVARIVHGISSPLFPAVEFARTQFWGKQELTSFKDVMKITKQLIVSVRKAKLKKNLPT